MELVAVSLALLAMGIYSPALFLSGRPTAVLETFEKDFTPTPCRDSKNGTPVQEKKDAVNVSKGNTVGEAVLQCGRQKSEVFANILKMK